VSNAAGKLVVRVKGLATAASLGLAPGQECRDIRIDVFDAATGGLIESCFEGFTP
jgi:hypothetical protein